MCNVLSWKLRRRPATSWSGCEFEGANYVEHDGEAEILPGVRVVPTRASPAIELVIVDTDDGLVVVAGDVGYTWGQFDRSESGQALMAIRPAADLARARRPSHATSAGMSAQAGHPLRPQRRRGDRLPGGRRGRHRPRVVHDFVSNLVYGWESPHMRAFLRACSPGFVPAHPLRQAGRRGSPTTAVS